ncbi:MAG TPA: hypothetical protein VFI29_13610 [Hanamia sp.]|nr:hypothetical protein [Hanamia sp.]
MRPEEDPNKNQVKNAKKCRQTPVMPCNVRKDIAGVGSRKNVVESVGNQP